MKIITAGRDEAERFFDGSGIREARDLAHTPLLVFVQKEEAVEVHIVKCADVLLSMYPDDTPVMAQWAGKWRSDFFKFTVGQFRAYVKAVPKSPNQVA